MWTRLQVIFTLATTVQRETLQQNLLIMDTISTNTLGQLPASPHFLTPILPHLSASSPRDTSEGQGWARVLRVRWSTPASASARCPPRSATCSAGRGSCRRVVVHV